MASKPTLGYWALRGFGQPIRMLLHYLEIDFEDKRYTSFDVWGNEKFNLGLDFPNIPYWIEGNTKITESKAILKYIAREKGNGLNLDSVELKWKAEMFESFLTDFWRTLLHTCTEWTDALRETFAKNVPRYMEQVEKFIGSNKFALGNKITYVDFLLYEILYHYKTYDDKILNSYPGLQGYMKNFETVPTISKYMASPEYIKGPCANPYAKHPI